MGAEPVTRPCVDDAKQDKTVDRLGSTIAARSEKSLPAGKLLPAKEWQVSEGVGINDWACHRREK